MQPDELDRLLSEEDVIAPSAGFADAVMSEVSREAEAPPRIGFPWKAVLAGLSSASLGAAAAVAQGLTTSTPVAAAQWARLADAIGLCAKDLAAAGASEVAASLVVAMIFLLVPAAVYELMLRARN
jgi:hypothetical protein